MICEVQHTKNSQCISPRPLLQIESGGVRYGNHQALRDIDLTILEGDRLAVIGPNGSGKTTLLRLLLGLELPSEGRIVWMSKPRPSIGYVPQRLNFDRLFPLTVEEFMAVNYSQTGLWLGGVPRRVKEKINDALARTSISDTKSQLLGTLSGGQLQRVLVAAALLQRPSVLILDEPSANIDLHGSDELRRLLSELHKSDNLTLIFVSHDLHFVSELSNRVACLNGYLCGFGETQKILSSDLLENYFGRSIGLSPSLKNSAREET
ncbi:MAG: metal ABC transporter ATP-binding protein [Verrucomicrobiota bacterium]